MRFWFTLIVSTVAISAGMTWLVMHQGAQIEPPPARVTVASKVPPQIAFPPAPGLKVEANYLEVKAAPSVVGRQYAVEVRFRNQGQGPLELYLFRRGPGCTEVALDGKPLAENGERVVKAPGSEGTIRVTWSPAANHLEGQEGGGAHFTCDLQHNDPRLNDTIHIEVISPVTPR
jgi:hypothetical protein